MAEIERSPWLTIVGINEDGPAGLSSASRTAIHHADLVTGATRHLALLPDLPCDVLPWPIPFEDGIALLLEQRGRRVVMLVSGDPFWFGAGTVIARHLRRDEWVAHPAVSTFGFAAARLGWSIDDTACVGLHAAPFTRLRPILAPGRQAIVLVRDGTAVGLLARYLDGVGFGASTLWILESLGGPFERIRRTTAATFDISDIAHPVAVGISVSGDGAVLPCAAGRPDHWFEHDGQITKRPVRALTLSALAPRPGERLWDIGAGSGSIGIEWLLAHPSTEAVAFEADAVRADRVRLNAATLGVDRLRVVNARVPDGLEGLPLPDVVFVGGGLSHALLERLWTMLDAATRLVANAVTLESEALLTQWHAAKGGTLLRIELAEAAPLGTRRGWRAQYPVVQWSVTL
ncbi:precorrin-6y C5,15-methyltransferase (decarboxylating) subunit CbiE [Sphingomonas sp. PB2P12]|uniref:precorrin-6y C5,15-methyltransferase (decarboxylating) subunit CbiE n=1 Tax=Sphingomonas sandaracina TaxID=3096157 RepID=UPI002FC81789